MKEQLYTIPVNDAFSKECECPICAMYSELETNSVQFTMGPSYMEDDIRAMTDEMGFCEKHMRQVFKVENRLGQALILHTHMVKTNRDIRNLTSENKKSGFFKKQDNSRLIDYINRLNNSCFICSRIEDTFKRYIRTVHYLWEKDEVFRSKYRTSKGFCTRHYGVLIEQASANLSGSNLDKFIEDTNKIYLENMERVEKDLEWFIDKFDYRHKDEPWKNSKDALPRTLTKVNSIFDEGEEGEKQDI